MMREPAGGVPLEPRKTENVQHHAVDTHGCVLLEVTTEDGRTYFTPVELFTARVLGNLDANIAAVRALLEGIGVAELIEETDEHLRGNDGTNT